MNLKYILIFLILIGAVNKNYSQSISNVKSALENNQIIVSYTLESKQNAFIDLFISEDGGKNFTGPLKNVSGDVGINIKSGANKKIVWDVLKDRNFLVSNNVVFRVKANSMFGLYTDPRDGKTYKIVNIGSQVWMAENLVYKPESGNYWAYNNIKSNVAKYGYLYDWETACKICPKGWHLPSDAEWTQLTNFLGNNSGTKLKAKDGWKSDVNGTDDHEFSALPGGYWNHNRSLFIEEGNYGNWWSKDEYDASNAYIRILYSHYAHLHRSITNKSNGISVRCLKD